MGVLKSAWLSFVTQVKTDGPLSSDVNKFVIGFKDQQLSPDKFPAVIINLNEIEDENISQPHKLWGKLNISLIVKAKGANNEALVSKILDLSEKARNAVLKDTKIGGTATDTNLLSNSIGKFSNNFIESEMIFEVITNRITGGSL